MYYLGIDTSNYSTSLAVYSSDTREVVVKYKKILDVDFGKTGLRQSDAVFLHTRNIPQAVEEAAKVVDFSKIEAIGVSSKPRWREDSYMPCFLSGVAVARSLGAALKKEVFEFSHQAGHVMAALYGTGYSEVENKDFIAFHISGGTTDALKCSLSGASLTVETAATSLDLFAGQAVDRTGNLLSLRFPSGEQLTELAKSCDKNDYMKPVLKDGNCCLSGLENKCRAIFEKTGDAAYTARYCLISVAETVLAMLDAIPESRNGDIILAGGVMSSEVIRKYIKAKRGNVFFAEPAYLSADNAVGTAILAYRAREKQ